MQTQGIQKRLQQLFEIIKIAAAVLRDTLDSFTEHECTTRAAGLAYRALLSLFPFILFLIYGGMFFLESAETQEMIYALLDQIAPTALEFIRQTVDQTLQARGPIGWVGGIGLLWSASSISNAMILSLNAIWNGKRRSGWNRSLMAAFSIGSLSVLFMLSVAFSALSTIDIPGQELLNRVWINRTISMLFTILFFMVLNAWLPNRSVNKRAAFLGGTLTAVLWELAKFVFGWYLTSGLGDYGLVYGSFASLIAFMLWVFLTAEILLLGAEFGAALERRFWLRDENPAKSNAP